MCACVWASPKIDVKRQQSEPFLSTMLWIIIYPDPVIFVLVVFNSVRTHTYLITICCPFYGLALNVSNELQNLRTKKKMKFQRKYASHKGETITVAAC